MTPPPETPTGTPAPSSAPPRRRSLFDIQINGFAGIDFQQPTLDAPDFLHAIRALAMAETLRFFPTLITDSIPALVAKLENLELLCKAHPEAAEAIAGYHLEGPWLSPEPGFRGAHDPRFMGAPCLTDFHQLQRAAGGKIRLLTLAPEWPGSEDFIRALTGEGVHVSLGHTDASDHEIDRAIQAGARFCTHLGNGVPAVLPRHDNIIQRLLARDELTAFFIPDGIHLPPAVLRNFHRAKPPGRALFTTDAMAAAGAPPGRYRLAGLELEVGADRIVRLPGSAHFAGSALSPDRMPHHLSAWLGMDPEAARHACSTAPAAAFGITLPDLA